MAKLFTIILSIFFINAAKAQPCTGSIGDPIVQFTFGSGLNFGPPLPAGITNLQYLQTYCFTVGHRYTIVNSAPSCTANKIHAVPADHTGNADGYFMDCWAGAFTGTQPDICYVDTVNGLCTGTTYQFAAWLLNMVNDSRYTMPNITLLIKKPDGTVLDSVKTGNMPRMATPTWVQYGFNFKTPPSISTVVLQIQVNNEYDIYTGPVLLNYFALDDITFSPVGPAITTGITGITGTTANVCTGNSDSLQFHATVDSCYISTAYQWQESTDGGITYTDIPGATSRNYMRPPGAGGQYLYRLVVAQAGNIASPACRVFSAPLTVVETPPPAVSIGATAGNICAGSPATFVATVTNTGSLVTYQWKRNGHNTGTNSRIFTSQSLSNGDTISCTIANVSGCPQQVVSNTIIVNVNPPVAPGISIAAGSTTVCTGSVAGFTATAVYGGTQPVYQWSINANPAGSNNNFSSTALVNGDTVRCRLTSNAACAINPTVVSNYIVMKVADTAAPVVRITADTNNVCQGTPISFSALVLNGGAAPAYQWKINGVNAGGNTPLFTSSSLTNSDTVSCVLTGSAACQSVATVNSNRVVVMIKTPVTPAVSITSDTNDVCAGTTLNFRATVMNGGTSPVYQWKINGSPVGTNSPVFSTNTTANGEVVSCTMVSNAVCTTNPVAISNIISLVIKSRVVPVVRITASDTIICRGAPVVFTATATNMGTTPFYQWKLNGIATGNSSATFSSTTLRSKDSVSCYFVSSLACNQPATSNKIAMVVNPLPFISLGPDKQLAAGGSVLLTPVTSGTIAHYLWTPPAGLNSDTIRTPIASPAATTTYTLKVTTPENCEATAVITVKRLPPVIIPNVFSPNGDGINDVWEIRSLADYPGCEITIFSRYGQAIFHSIGYNKPWDGTTNGKGLPVGEYYYLINLNNGAGKLTGGVMLLR